MEAIKEFRDKHGMAQPQMARMMGVPITTLRNWERGERHPNAAALRLMEVFTTLEVICPTILATFISLAKKESDQETQNDD